MLVHSSIPSPDWQSFDLTQWFSDLGLTFLVTGNHFVIHAYALCILLGIVLATVLTSRRLTSRGAEPGVVLDIILWAIPFGIIGARIYHVLTHPGDYFYPGADLLRTLYVWEGGIAIFGALLGGAVGAYIGCRLAGVRFWAFADALAPGMLLAQAAGRLGNYFNHELFGTPTTLPWGLEIEPTNPAFPIGLPAGTLFQPTFLYEILWNLAGVLVILGLERGSKTAVGQVLCGLPDLVRHRACHVGDHAGRPERDPLWRAHERVGCMGGNPRRNHYFHRSDPSTPGAGNQPISPRFGMGSAQL